MFTKCRLSSLRPLLTRGYLRLKGPPKAVTTADAVSLIRSGERIYFHGVAAFPSNIAKALAERQDELRGVEICHIHVEGDNPLAGADMAKSFFINNLFVGANLRQAVAEGRSSYVPCFLSEIPKLMRTGVMSPDWSIINVSPPDKHGYCSLGVEVATALAATESSKMVIAQINRFMPRTHGQSNIHLHCFDYIIPDMDIPLPTKQIPLIEKEDMLIAQHIAQLIPDGACLQLGIGGIPNAVLSALTHHKHLGVHTEMFQDGLIDLIQHGIVDNSRKVYMRGRSVTSFVMGTQRLYDFVDDNPGVSFLDSAVTNDPLVIMRNPYMVAINSAVEVDITGQVCADSIGTRQISGVGGQVDFERGAALSPNGVPIICLKSRTKKGDSTIVNTLRPGAGVVTTRHHVHYVVTEWGAANLFGLNFLQRARELIKLAHPDDRESLERQAFERFHVDVTRFGAR